VGKGKAAPQWIAELLATRDRARAAPTFSPRGLYLSAVEYPPSWQLPAFPDTDVLAHLEGLAA
jgi:tRNA pseudouridine38-40 synthase